MIDVITSSDNIESEFLEKAERLKLLSSLLRARFSPDEVTEILSAVSLVDTLWNTGDEHCRDALRLEVRRVEARLAVQGREVQTPS